MQGQQNVLKKTTVKKVKKRTAHNIIKKEMGKGHSVEQASTLLVNNNKLKDSRNMTIAFNNYWRQWPHSFFTTTTEKLNI